MHRKTTELEPLDGLAAGAVSLGRKVAEEAHRLSVGANGTDVALVRRLLERLAARQPFDLWEDGSLDAVRGHLAADLDAETLRIDRVFDEQAFDREGNQGVVVDEPVRTERGQDIAALSRLFESFVEARDATLDRIAAESALAQLMR